MHTDPDTVIMPIDTRLGPVTLATTRAGMCGLWFAGQKHHPDTSAWRRDDQHPWLMQARDELTQYLDRQRTRFAVPLDLSAGSAFQQAVWRALCAIPAGGTTSYGAIARQVGRATATRAVGAAVGRNPISILVPCHRVLAGNGALTGYAGGLERKRALLALEMRRDASHSSTTRAPRTPETGTIAA